MSPPDGGAFIPCRLYNCMVSLFHRMARQIYTIASWTLPALFMLTVGALFIRRGLAQRFPFFMAYLASNLLHGAVTLYALRVYGTRTVPEFILYSVFEGVSLICRGLFIAELCYNYLGNYRGVWGITWRLLAAVAAGLGVAAALAATPRTYWIGGFVLRLQGGLEIVSATSLLFLLAIAAYYGIEVPRIGRLMAVGFVAYSASMILYDIVTVKWYNLVKYVTPVPEVCFLLVFSFLIAALWKPLALEKPAPILLHPNIYRQTVPQMNYRLQVLNDRLLEFLRS
jgi:hypothetical protein